MKGIDTKDFFPYKNPLDWIKNFIALKNWNARRRITISFDKSEMNTWNPSKASGWDTETEYYITFFNRFCFTYFTRKH